MLLKMEHLQLTVTFWSLHFSHTWLVWFQVRFAGKHSSPVSRCFVSIMRHWIEGADIPQFLSQLQLEFHGFLSMFFLCWQDFLALARWKNQKVPTCIYVSKKGVTQSTRGCPFLKVAQNVLNQKKISKWMKKKNTKQNIGNQKSKRSVDWKWSHCRPASSLPGTKTLNRASCNSPDLGWQLLPQLDANSSKLKQKSGSSHLCFKQSTKRRASQTAELTEVRWASPEV